MQKISDGIELIINNNLILFSNTLNSHSGATSFNMDQFGNRFECSNTLYSYVNKTCILKILIW